MFQIADRNMKVFKERRITDKKLWSGGNKKKSGQDCVKDQEVDGQ